MQYDAFKTYDPVERIPDVTARVSDERAARRLNDLTNVVETSFARGRLANLDAANSARPEHRCRSQDDVVRAAEGVRRSRSAAVAQGSIWR